MTKKSDRAETPQESREKVEAAARGDTDKIQLTNGSGERKDLTPEEWEIQKEMLLSDGWQIMGQDESNDRQTK